MPDQQKFTNKLQGVRILIIGGSSGIGFAVAEAAVEYGAAKVIISSSQESRVQEGIKRLQASYPSSTATITGVACNMGDENTLEATIEGLFKQTGPLDHIVYTAGDPLALSSLPDITFSLVKQAGMVRFFAPFLVAKYGSQVLPNTAASSIMLTTGAVCERPIVNFTVPGSYATALQGLTRGLALDLKPIRVNLISPGAVNTELWNTLPEDRKDAMMESMAKRAATGKVASAEDVAEAYLYCMRDANITGSMISTNGGALIL